MSKVFLPRTSNELRQLKKEHQEAALFAGGTDLLVQLRTGRKPRPALLIGLERLEELQRIEERPDEIVIGAAATHSRLLASDPVRKNFPLLIQALTHLGSPQIRNMGTIGGNIMTASPAGDTLPPLYILKAEIELSGETGTRRLPLSDFITGPGQTRIDETEILSRIIIPKKPSFNHYFFEKVGLRQALSIAVVSLAALYDLTPDNTITAIRLAWGSIGPTIVIRPEIEKFLLGRVLTPKLLNEAAGHLGELIEPISDIRAAADYRRRVAGNLLKRLVDSECRDR